MAMQMRKRVLRILVVLGFGVAALAALAQGRPGFGNAEPVLQQRDAAGDTPAEAPPAEAPPAEEGAGEEDWELPELPDDLLEDDVFIPTEEIEADEEITFPVDI